MIFYYSILPIIIFAILMNIGYKFTTFNKWSKRFPKKDNINPLEIENNVLIAFNGNPIPFPYYKIEMDESRIIIEYTFPIGLFLGFPKIDINVEIVDIHALNKSVCIQHKESMLIIHGKAVKIFKKYLNKNNDNDIEI